MDNRESWATQGRAVSGSTCEEPILDTHDIQGNILVGFNTDYQILLFLEIKKVASAKHWLRTTGRDITCFEDVLHRKHRSVGGSVLSRTWINIAFSFKGLRKLTDEADAFMDVPFKEGLHNRSWLLGDPTEPDAEGHCQNWIIGSPHTVPDVFLIVASDARDSLADRVAQIEASLPSSLRVMFKECGVRLYGTQGVHEHFGFRDPISQPGLRGRLSADPTDFLTPRQNPANPHQGKPGQNLIWPGEFVFGYPGQDAMDLLRPGIIANAGPAWSKNGSFLVFRRLRQDVVAFRNFLQSAAAELSTRIPALADLTPEGLSAKFLGRWPSGAPILRAPVADNAQLAQDACASNNFRFVEPVLPIADAGPGQCGDDVFPQSLGDVLGLICPQAAHIRKAYPRDHATSIDSVASMETHRLLRRGIPFGEPFPAPGERGLLFLAYQTSIERQFEFITRAWFNNPHLRSGGDGYDPIVGQRVYAVRGNRTRSFVLPYQNRDGTIERITLQLPTDWVIPTGGGYFYAPSLSAIQYLTR